MKHGHNIRVNLRKRNKGNEKPSVQVWIMAMGLTRAKTALPIRPPWGKTAPLYKGTKVHRDYPFGKRLING
jgi:hypothetical protein